MIPGIIFFGTVIFVFRIWYVHNRRFSSCYNDLLAYINAQEVNKGWSIDSGLFGRTRFFLNPSRIFNEQDDAETTRRKKVLVEVASDGRNVMRRMLTVAAIGLLLAVLGGWIQELIIHFCNQKPAAHSVLLV